MWAGVHVCMWVCLYVSDFAWEYVSVCGCKGVYVGLYIRYYAWLCMCTCVVRPCTSYLHSTKTYIYTNIGQIFITFKFWFLQIEISFMLIWRFACYFFCDYNLTQLFKSFYWHKHFIRWTIFLENIYLQNYLFQKLYQKSFI